MKTCARWMVILGSMMLVGAPACVGEVPPDPDNNGTSGPDAAPAAMAPDAAPVAMAKWAPLTTPPAAGGFVHFVSETEIYAVIGGTKICMWNGSQWIEIAAAPADVKIGPYFDFRSATEIYAILGQKICRWDGSKWLPITNVDNALLAEAGGQFHVVPGTAVFAFIGQKICKWDINDPGAGWQIVSPENANLRPGGMHFVSENLIYVVIGEKVCKWDGTRYVEVAGEGASLAAGFQFTAENDIVAVLGNKICRWDGTQWVKITDEAPGLLAAGFHQGPNGTFYSPGINGIVYRWK